MLALGTGLGTATGLSILPGIALFPTALCLLLGTSTLFLAQMATGTAGPELLSSVEATRSARLAALLSTEREPITIETIRTRIGWTEDAIVSGLSGLQRAGRLEEDLDLDSGHWNYRLKQSIDTEEIPKHALPLRERVALAEDALSQETAVVVDEHEESQ